MRHRQAHSPTRCAVSFGVCHRGLDPTFGRARVRLPRALLPHPHPAQRLSGAGRRSGCNDRATRDDCGGALPLGSAGSAALAGT